MKNSCIHMKAVIYQLLVMEERAKKTDNKSSEDIHRLNTLLQNSAINSNHHQYDELVNLIGHYFALDNKGRSCYKEYAEIEYELQQAVARGTTTNNPHQLFHHSKMLASSSPGHSIAMPTKNA